MESVDREPRPRRVAGVVMTALSAGLMLIAAAYGSAFVTPGGAGWSAPVFATGTGLTLGAMMALGAMARGRLGSLWLPIVTSAVIVTGGFVLAWAMPAAESADEVLWLGLPRRAAIVLYGVGLVPVFILPLAYAATFEAATLRAEDIERVRAMRAAAPTGPTPRRDDLTARDS